MQPSPHVLEATIRAETRTFAMALAHYTSAVVMAHDNPYRTRALEAALGEFTAAGARVREALAGKAALDIHGGRPED